MLGTHARSIFEEKYRFNDNEKWEGAAFRVASWLFGDHSHMTGRLAMAIARRKIMPGGRYLYAAARPKPQINNCFLFRCPDSAEGWGEVTKKAMLAMMKGGGTGVWYGDVRPAGGTIKGYGGTSNGPLSMMHSINDVGRRMKEGASRRSANWAGLPWNHPDVYTFMRSKMWSEEIREMKSRNYDFPADLDQTNISIGLDDDFFAAAQHDEKTWNLFLQAVDIARTYGDPGFSIDCGERTGENLRNPCTEVTSWDDDDVCNLGSVNFARMNSLSDLEEHCRLAVRMLYQGTFRSFIPFRQAHKLRERNRRIGVGILGLHEWCLQRGHAYEPTEELGEWLTVWEQVTNEEARKVSTETGEAMPAGVRAVAPTGTISMVAETSMGMEPLFAVAQKRRWRDIDGWKYRYMVNPVADRFIKQGMNPDDIEDAYTLGRDIERRLGMQEFLQRYTDMGISSTINLPPVGKPGNDDTEKLAGSLIKYLPKLRGVTIYPDGAHSGQPMEKVSYEEALEHGDDIVIEDTDVCDIRGGGKCGA